MYVLVPVSLTPLPPSERTRSCLEEKDVALAMPVFCQTTTVFVLDSSRKKSEPHLPKCVPIIIRLHSASEKKKPVQNCT